MEGLLHYINPAHAISLLSALNEERLKGQLCDVLLIVGDQKFRAHKNVLAASSEYFQSLFTDKEHEAQSVFQLDFCEPDAFDNVLNYIYSSSLFVEKGSLAAVQELGYSLGISFLTNIVSRTPQAPFPTCPSRRKVSVEDDDTTNHNSSQKRSVIVCQSRNEAPGKAGGQSQPEPSQAPQPAPAKGSTGKPHTPKAAEPAHSLSVTEKSWPKDGPGGPAKALEQPGPVADASRAGLAKRNASLPLPDREVGEEKPGAGAQLPKGKAVELALKRPRPPVLSLRSSSETPYLLQETPKGGGQGEDRSLLYYSKLGLVIPSAGGAARPAAQSIDRSGPLVKSLLRRSLSMDSQVPVYPPSLELQAAPGAPVLAGETPGSVFCALSHKPVLKDGSGGGGEKPATPDERRPTLQPHRLRSFSASQSTDREGASPVSEVRIKTEPSSPMSEPLDIIRVTVGDATASSSSSSATRDLPVKAEDDPKDMSRLPAKRRFQADHRLPFKKPKANEHGSPVLDDPCEAGSSPPLLQHAHFPDSDLNQDEFGELEGTRPNRKFKCKHCLKIFRSMAGLHRHANMYHNPEKPYACDICHKRFHTNFKVWTHCQTQHGIVKNPSPAASAQAVLDEKFQRKLIDIVREREIKKALLVKLRRTKPGFQGQGSAQAPQAGKRSLRARGKAAYICTHCGKACRFLSQYKQHIKMHPGEKALGGGGGVARVLKPKEQAPVAGPVGSRGLFHCRLCNAKLSSLVEQGSHERLCRNASVCTYCSLRFCSAELKQEHEGRCEYRKLTCLECMRTFKSSFSIWRHQVEVHNQNSMAPAAGCPVLDHNGDVGGACRPQAQPEPDRDGPAAQDASACSDTSEQVHLDSEDSCLPEDLSLSRQQLKVQVKEEPADEAEDETAAASPAPKAAGPGKAAGLWPCEKCGKVFTAHKQLERHQELLCSVKPFICHVCHKAFRTNFRLWSHFQSHMSQATEEPAAHKEASAGPAPTNSPSPPPLPPALPKIQPLEPDSPTGSLPETAAPAAEKLFAPQESDTLFYHAPPLSAITFKRQFMCKLCHRTFKTAFSLWSHEQTHT
ncbi:zinc finger and BTB domain-containing protein 21 isoform X1 [Ochotona curzoniae]|uniref:zinc finger and BTB domain-containing protein 21 isoform X1 n=1 Tax=Ochotona curzoniae TaxID=130825 RepID=UPI001B3491F4|nr:zinc finger and BTB domain-containing protein 21 isoform X1 [Ochotona curzoniae]